MKHCCFLTIALAACMSGCVAYRPAENPIANLSVNQCGADQSEHPLPTLIKYDPEPLSIEDSAKVFILKSSDADRLIVIPNELVFRDATLFTHFGSFLGIRYLIRGSLIVRLSSSDLAPPIAGIVSPLQKKYPQAQIQRPWMVNAHLSPLSPFIPTAAAILPCDAGPIGDIPLQFELSEQDVTRLLAFDAGDLILACRSAKCRLLDNPLYPG